VKNTNLCPKCNSEDIARVEGHTRGHGAGSNIPVGATIFQTVPVTRYVCGQCGFIESWIDSSDDVAKVKEKYSE
jgi:predicted RNA-binding Zn-ribbon protein involved in translation (DUF1610 family)